MRGAPGLAAKMLICEAAVTKLEVSMEWVFVLGMCDFQVRFDGMFCLSGDLDRFWVVSVAGREGGPRWVKEWGGPTLGVCVITFGWCGWTRWLSGR